MKGRFIAKLMSSSLGIYPQDAEHFAKLRIN